MNVNNLTRILNANNGYITTKEIDENVVSKTYIPELIKQGLIRKVSNGLYIDNNLIEDEYYILQRRYKDIVFSYNTAFHLLGLSERAPYKIDITTINHKQINEDLNIHYISKEKLNIGVIEIQSPYSNPIKIYNAERCICDMLKNQNEYDIETYNKIINKYFNSKNKNIILLDEYAKEFNVYEKLTTIKDVLMKL